jgi:hypothetical protein
VTIPLRSMLIESPTKAILISPVGSPAERGALDGKTAVVVEPSLLHHKGLGAIVDAVRPREVWGPPGFGHKLRAYRDAYVFGADPWPHDDLLSFTLLEGVPFRNEVVFFHRPSRTLYTADLVFAIMEPKGLLTPLAMGMLGVYKRFGVAKMWTRWVKDKAAFGRSIDRVMGWSFDRIVMAHGETIEGNAREKLFAALRERELV